MIIDCISDLHGEFPLLEGGDLLIVAGDLVGHSTSTAMEFFNTWIGKQDYKKKVVIAGNHDTFIEKHGMPDKLNYTYLEDSGCTFKGKKIWGTPWTKWFYGIHPMCKAYTKMTDEKLKEKWDLIPEDVNILITHSPPMGIFDLTNRGEQVGSTSLRIKTLSGALPKLKLHVFGHIHECGGNKMDIGNHKAVNASVLNSDYEHVNQPVRIML